jgi:integrating conjugative element protein (TIGR03765 family)
MRRSVLYCLLLPLVSVFAQADALTVRRAPTVVYEGRSTISAKTYYQRLERGAASSSVITAPEHAGVKPLEERLPLIPTRLSVGQPSMQTQDGQIIPVFIMGMDTVSLTWFNEAADGLADIGARGVVVQADRLAHWHQLKQYAADHGIDLMLLEGESLADGYGISTYPVVIVSPQLAKQGGHE